MIEYYISRSDESSVKSEVEMDFLDDAPQAERTWLLWAFIKVDAVTEEGFPTEEALSKVNETIDKLNAILSDELNALYVGRRYEDGWVELYYYAPSAKKFQATVAKVIGSEYMCDSGSTKDAKWEHYIYTLYPNDLMLQQVQSRHIMDELSEAGDDFSVEREVEHYLGFLTEGQAKRVAEALYLHGFKEKEITYNSSEEYGNTLVMTKTHTLENALLEELAFLLITSAENEHGIYVGWSSGVAS